MKKIVFLVFCVFALHLQAEKISVFVASSASKAMSELREIFIQNYPKDEVELIFGASGKHYQLLKEGREFDLFFSADAKYAEQIAKDGNALSEPQIYALGVVALYSLDEALLEGGVEKLGEKADKIKHLSIANPKVAPYGVAASEILKNLKLDDKFKDKIVLGDSISQPVLHIDSGAAELGIVAYSLVSSVNQPKGKAVLINPKLYTPLKQSFVLTKHAKDKKLALEFANFIQSDEAKAIFKKYGFNTP
ncbi:molybdate ABC transporter substrate-binding protein [Campylobacter helveticus]|uniref:molybdate ABC transporter substrate-binding protein n=1 Tax=Campylobacter helveticus TaxID=28898 RepID=UPI0009C21168|nr:molybdate ABC transporter substrate-binding protein [Campylobacter helveticus]ARE80681.1 molybdenum ABC transporter ModABC, periplasmic molybdate-binding protein [Campylobacter helveticus]MCR2055039.1 molybdate ABC transporter substrate-binding protein [Campylobacter helveticus]TNB59228.1 molybdate ABC transporter substrate-binding protein [Campylobacter helveticus]TNH34941.1 molybdate ABC transporter substrate-binding protein [Campylobacter helveticus]TXK51642.1 molybdate ABC transporter s